METQKDSNSGKERQKTSTTDSSLKLKSDMFSREFFGARKRTILRLKKSYELYERERFEDEEGARKREAVYLQEFARLEEYFDMDKGGNVLDIGCGTGDFLALFGTKWKKYGIEISDFTRKIAEEKGIITDFKLEDGFFDLIIFRGTIQHIPDPVCRIGECYYWLKEGGGLVFLATPNTNSIYYRLFNTLPMLVERYNFLLPSDKMLKQILNNFGFEIKGFEYPYRNTPYARPVRDLLPFFLKLLRIRKDIKFPFYRNMMECYAQKPGAEKDEIDQ